MVYNVYLGYPSAPDSHFDTDYYVKTHMGLVEKHWKQYNLLHWSVSKVEGEDAPYLVQATLVFSDQESFQKAVADGSIIWEDIPKFTSIKVKVWHGNEIGVQK
jgi:uncharacterized protein (TIGR02118 family)